MERFLWIGLAGALGTWTRYLVQLGAARVFGIEFPYGTLAANLLGCFLIALVMHMAIVTAHVSETQRLALTTGFMGGLTTYSAFNYESAKLAREGAGASAALYFGLTIGGCVVAGILGLALAKKLFGA